jgi:rubrerythrin
MTGRREPGSPAPAAAPDDAIAAPGADVPRTLADFMAQAYAMERDAAQRYTEFADAMEMHNNLDVAALFRKMAGIEARHAEQIMATMRWTKPPEELERRRWPGFEAPETVAIDDVHYLMQPYHALELALAAEERAAEFFAHLARATDAAPVREAALEMAAEEREHVELVKAWLAKVPPPDAGWADDPDPPRYMD